MKIISGKLLTLSLIIVSLLGPGCEKEDLTVELTGVYEGTAVETNYPDYIPVTFQNARIEITRVNNEIINVKVIKDPTNPADTYSISPKLKSSTSFYHVTGAPRIYTTIDDGILTGSDLMFKHEQNNAGAIFKLTFAGSKN